MTKKTDGAETISETVSAPENTPESGTKAVRVNHASEKVNAGTAFIHPEARLVIRDELVSVPDDEWTQGMLASRFLTEK